jgi:hypothetical protein
VPDEERFVLCYDARGASDLWWIDDDGDVLYWDQEKPPQCPYEVRHCAEMNFDDLPRDAVAAAIAAAPVAVDFDWQRDFVRGGKDPVFLIETLEKFVVRCWYYVRAPTKAAAKKKVKGGQAAYHEKVIEEGGGEFLGFEACEKVSNAPPAEINQ